MEVSPVLKVLPGLCSSRFEMPGGRLQEAAREAWALVRAQPRITVDPLVHVSGSQSESGLPWQPRHSACLTPGRGWRGRGGRGGDRAEGHRLRGKSGWLYDSPPARARDSLELSRAGPDP